MKIKNLKFKIKNSAGGFTLLFAVLVSVLVLAVGASIISIALKQVVLSGSSRESQYAFYASNTGLECALYWDLHPHDVGDGTLQYVFPAVFASAGITQDEWEENDMITCEGGEIKTGDEFPDSPFLEVDPDWTLDNEYRFRIAITNDVADSIMYCAEVEVTKEYDSSNGRIITTITSQGLNTCDPENNPRAVERGLVLRYES